MNATATTRQRAFIPDPGDEGMFDTLGFWEWGTFRGEWSGTSAWLADMPLPEVAEGSLVQDLPPNAHAVQDARDAIAAGTFEAVTFRVYVWSVRP